MESLVEEERLIGASDRLGSEDLERALGEAGVRSVPVRVLPEVDSTNDELRRWAEAGASEWAVVLAEAQTAGRGRRGRAWSSPPGRNLYLSVLAPAPTGPGQRPRLPILAVVAAADALRDVAAEPRFKWPNDLLARTGRKLGGLLVEDAGGDRTGHAVGIGLNVNAGKGELVPEASSLFLEDGRTRDRALLAGRLVRRLREWWDLLDREGFGPVARSWSEKALWIGRTVRVAGEAEELSGKMLGIDEWGRLRLSTREGERLLSAGEVSLRPGRGRE